MGAEHAEEDQGTGRQQDSSGGPAHPAPKPPLLFSLNGIGLRMVGHRALTDTRTSYIKTRFVTLVFVPVLALDAWRVQDADGGWYFLAKERLTRFDRRLNAVVLAGVAIILGLAGWRAHTGTPEYRAARTLVQADALRAEGRLDDALELYVGLVEGDTPESASATLRLDELPSELASAVPAVAANTLNSLHGVRAVETQPFFEAAFTAAERHLAREPEAALALLEQLVRELPLDASPERTAELLLACCAARPDDPRPASLLAEVWERAGELTRAEAALAPHAGRLGTLEGARILGQIHLGAERLEESRQLLEAYVSERLPRLRRARAEFEGLLERAQELAFERLDEDKAFYRRWEAASEAERERLVEERISADLRADRTLAQAQAELEHLGAVVPAVLALGVAELRLAQGASGPERERGLAQAEKTFLSVRADAGEEAEYLFFLGQVYHWLGRPAEGHALLEQYLATEGRTHAALLSVAGVQREVGLDNEARTLAEEAFASAEDDEERGAAASLRYVLGRDSADRQTWLKRCSSGDPFFLASQTYERGLEALNRGQRAEAEARLSEAVEILSGTTGSSSAYNNAAVAQRALATLRGTPEAYGKALELMERSLALEPTSTTGLWNTAENYLARLTLVLTRDTLDHARLLLTPSLEHLDFLYDDEAGRRALVARLASEADLQRALECLTRHSTLAPQEAGAYLWRLAIVQRLHDTEALARLEQESAAFVPENADDRETLRRYYAGEEWALPERRQTVARLEALLPELDPVEGASYALAATALVSALQGLAPALAPEATDAEHLVALAEAAWNASPSRATRQALHAALAHRAVLRLAAAHPELAETLRRTWRSTGAAPLLPFVLNTPGPLAEAVARDADVLRIRELESEAWRRFPENVRTAQWALLRVLAPELAPALAEALRADEFSSRVRRLGTRLSPMQPGWALEYHWELVLAGDVEGARALLAEYEQRGVPLPRLP